jgi:hypothetical protein
MRTGLTLLFALFSIVADAQVGDVKSGRSQKESNSTFKSRSEKENYLAAQLFAQQYGKEKYKKFGGKIIVNGNHYEFGAQTIELASTATELKVLLGKGILYPQLFIEDLLRDQDTLVISNLEEIKSTKKPVDYKRFKFYGSKKGSPTPTVYILELTNEKATEQTSIKSFISGAELTFFAEGWITI